MHRTSWIPHCVHGQIGDIGPVVGSVVTEVGLSTILQAVVISLFRGNMRRVNNFKKHNTSLSRDGILSVRWRCV